METSSARHHPENPFIGRRQIFVLPDILNQLCAYQGVMNGLARHGAAHFFDYSTHDFDIHQVIARLHGMIQNARNDGQPATLYGTSFGTRVILEYLAYAQEHDIDLSHLEMIWMNGFLPSFHDMTGGEGIIQMVQSENIRLMERYLRTGLKSDIHTPDLDQGMQARFHFMTSNYVEEFAHSGCPIICGYWEEDVITPTARGEWREKLGKSCYELTLPGLHGQTYSHAAQITTLMCAAFEDLERKHDGI